ncbi:MAG: histidinol dehydrogenase [candidate division KSB1 bacterium]|nr:histidinol dehydrogenase [candidate division KSB1 bacterium]
MNIYQKDQLTDFMHKFESRRLEISRDVEKAVADILQNVQQYGDRALVEYAQRFDRVNLNVHPLRVPEETLQQAHAQLDPELLDVLRGSRDNIKRYHEKAIPQSWLTWEDDGVVLGRRVQPLERVGVYVPGGLAAYPSSLLMGAVPAQVAGVAQICVTTPCNAEGKMNPLILAAAWELGIENVYRVGGAHAVAGMAFGTDTIPRVDKIVGPGNIYVATAKKMLYGQCGIDMVAGPSEVLIIADESADPAFAAADLLAQAEHDPLASSILVTPSSEVAKAVAIETEQQLLKLDRVEILNSSLAEYGGILLLDSMQECVEISNRLAPEHLGLHVRDPWTLLGDIKNAGAIFLGHYSPEAVGDYWAGPNHVLPTNGSARFFSPLRTEDFVKVSSLISYTQTAMQKHGEKIRRFAESEGLDAHASAIEKRMDSL